MKLTVKQVDSSKPKEKDYKLFDGGGLYLLVTKSGSKYWRLKYRIDGKEKVLAIGVYPTITLAEARKKRDDAKRQLSDGVDWSGQQKLVTVLEFSQYNRSDSLGVKPPLY
ncbi:DUF4102 domain-containing protein [Providencia stuartii]|nr:DUF4102 domain-containing protein [Providencia stuartii]